MIIAAPEGCGLFVKGANKNGPYNEGEKNCDTPPRIMMMPTARLTIRLR